MLTTPALASTAEDTAAATPLPGNKANWVVAVGGLNTAQANNYHNWARLGYYMFVPNGTVSTSYWSWNQVDQPRRVDTARADCGGGVPTCAVKTVEGFTGGPSGGYRGTYRYLDGGRLQVTWTKDSAGRALARPLTENWTLDTGLVAGGLARIASPTFRTAAVPAAGVFSDYSATFGIGYGSNAALSSTSRVSMAQLRNDGRYNARRYTGSFPVANAGVVARQGGGGDWYFGSGSPAAGDPNHRNPWRLCAGGDCIGWVQHRTARTSCDCPGDPDLDRVRYIAEIGDGRRDTEWYWCRCLAQGRPCYLANSHPRPMLQVVDDGNTFQGWVGVEAFTHVGAGTLRPDGDLAHGYFGVFDMVADPLAA